MHLHNPTHLHLPNHTDYLLALLPQLVDKVRTVQHLAPTRCGGGLQPSHALLCEGACLCLAGVL